jgi:cysteinyl-tRNA synthetase
VGLQLYDTRRRTVVPFEPIRPGAVGIYVCGPTVQGSPHVGHLKVAVAFDVLRRWLSSSGYDVTLVRNVTDIDDKIIENAAAEGVTVWALAERFTRQFNAAYDALGVLPPTVEPRATGHIPEMIAMITRLVDSGHAYAAEGSVWFSVRSYGDYGALSGQRPDAVQPSPESDEGKRDPRDFALWKAVKPGEPSWETPWGPGRPGWHLECSAMAAKYLGERFDIHGGGLDLVFPHHENERAQTVSTFCTGHDAESNASGEMADHWLHGGLLTSRGGEKMSKSLGNVVAIRDVGQTHDLEALRLHLIGVHYRSPLAFTVTRDAAGAAQFPELDEAEGRLAYFYRTLERLAGAPGQDDGGAVVAPADRTLAAFGEAMDDDFNTAAAVGHLYEAFVLANKLLDEPQGVAKDVRRRTLVRLRGDLAKCGETLGIFQREPAAFLTAYRGRLCARRGIDPVAVEARIAERAGARTAKDFARADQIRKDLQAAGVELMDTPAGTTWRVV